MDSLIRKMGVLLSRTRIPKIETDSSTSAFETFGNQLVLGHILTFLDLKSLKVARLVCRTWAAEGLKQLRDYGITIHLQPPFPNANAMEGLKGFVTHGQIWHTLMLSFQPQGWIFCKNVLQQTEEEQWADLFEYYGPRDTSSDLRILELLQNMGEFVKELRLEVNVMEKRDAELLTKVLASMPHLGKCSLDFPDFEKTGLLSISKGLFPPSVHTLGLRLHTFEMFGDGSKWGLEAAIHLMSVCSSSNIQFLDLCSWTQGRDPDEVSSRLWVKAIRLVLEEDPNAFPKLSGIRKTMHCEEECKDWIDLPKSLSSLYLFCYQWKHDQGVGELDNVRRILKRHSETLLTVDLNWFVNPAVEFQTPIHLPYFPILTTLEYTSRGALRWDGWTKEMVDGLNLRSIFHAGPQALRRLLPSLTTLSVFLLYEFGDEIWEYIFPDVDVKGNRLEFDQIKCINLSLVIDGSCVNNPKLTRFYSIFPSLTRLRHLKWEQVTPTNTDTTPIRFGPDLPKWYGTWGTPGGIVACEHSSPRGGPLGSTFPVTTTKMAWSWTLKPGEFSIQQYNFPIRYLLRSPLSDPCLWY